MISLDLAGKEFVISKSKNPNVLTGCQFSTLIMILDFDNFDKFFLHHCERYRDLSKGKKYKKGQYGRKQHKNLPKQS